MSFTLTKLPEKKDQVPQEQEKFTLSKPPEEAPLTKQRVRGMAQGGLDVLSMASLPLYPIERGLDMAFGLEDQQGLNPGQEANYSRQFNTLEKMQNQNYVPTLSELMDLQDDEMGYKTGNSLAALNKMQAEIPEGGFDQEAMRRVTRSLPFAVGGPAAYGAALGAEFTGMGAKEGVKALGGEEGLQTAADIVGGLGYGLSSLFRNSAPAEQIVPYVAQRQGGAMQAIEKQAPRTLEQRINSLSDNTINEFRDRINQITDRNIQQMTHFSAREIEDAITRETAGRILNRVSPNDILPQTAWREIQEGANGVFQAEQAAYTPLYETVREGSRNIYSNGSNAITSARNLLRRLVNVRTSPKDYAQTTNIVRDVIHDLTGVTPSENLIEALNSGNLNLVEQIFDGLIRGNRVRADRLMDLSIRLGDAINYETLVPNVKNLLRPLRTAVKDEFRAAIRNSDPQLLQTYNEADRLYAHTAERFGGDAISNLRGSQTPERMNAVFTQPSNFEHLVGVFGENSPFVRTAERQIIQDLGNSSTRVARDTFQQLEPFLSAEAQQAGREIIALGDNLAAPGQRRALQQSMLEDVSQAITTGQPPNYTTRAMMTPEGYRLAQNTFERSASGREVFATLERKLVSDIFDPIVVGDQIDWGRAAQILENPNTALVLNEIIGAEGVAMMQNMQRYGQNITANMGNLRNTQPNTFNKLISGMNSPTKIMVGAIVGKAVAAPLWLTGAATAVVLKNSLAALITNQNALRALRGLGNVTETGPALMRDANILNVALQTML